MCGITRLSHSALGVRRVLRLALCPTTASFLRNSGWRRNAILAIRLNFLFDSEYCWPEAGQADFSTRVIRTFQREA